MGFPCGSTGKESTCNAGDLGSIPGLGRSTGEGIGYTLPHSWVSLVAQLVKNPPAMQETWVQSLGWEDPREKGKATHSSILACSPWGRKESDTTERLHFHFSLSCIGEGNGNPLQCSCLENPRDGGAWWAAIYGVAQSRTRLKQLSSSSRGILKSRLPLILQETRPAVLTQRTNMQRQTSERDLAASAPCWQ